MTIGTPSLVCKYVVENKHSRDIWKAFDDERKRYVTVLKDFETILVGIIAMIY